MKSERRGASESASEEAEPAERAGSRGEHQPSPRARVFVLVPAAGGGTRFGMPGRKQYAPLAGRTLIGCTLDRLAQAFPEAPQAIAVSREDCEHAGALAALGRHVDVLPCGGDTRAATVRNAVRIVAERAAAHDWLLVHDAARPCVPLDALARLLASLADDPVGGLLAVPVADTPKRAGGDSGGHEPVPRVLCTEDRTGLWQAQTPQMFRVGVLTKALDASGATNVTDEAQAVELLAATGACLPPRLVPGSPLNLKVTYPADLALAEAVLARQARE